MLSQHDGHNILQVIFLINIGCQQWANIAHIISLFNVGPDWSRQNCRLFSCAKLFVDFGQHGTGNFLVQCWPRQIKKTLYKLSSCEKMILRSGQYCTSNFLFRTTLSQMHLTRLWTVGHHCKGSCLVQCWPRQI